MKNECAKNSAGIPGCVRQVTNLERAFLFTPGCNVSIVARIAGNVSEHELLRAMDTVRRIHPLVGAKIVFDERHNAWFSNDNVPALPLRVTKMTSDTQWFEEIQYEQRVPFELEKGPLIRFILLHSPEVSDLIVMCNHSICDGMALANLVRDILIYYADPERRITVLNPPDIMKLIPKKSGFSLSAILTQLFVYNANRKWKKSPHYFFQADYAAITRAYWEKMKCGAVLIELDNQESQIFLEKCRKEGVTVGSAVTAACIAAHNDILDPFTKNLKLVSVPFDLRRHATTSVGDVFCLCVGAPSFPYTYDVKKTFWENAAVLHQEVHKRVEKLDSTGLEVPGFEPSFIDAFACFGPMFKAIPETYSQTDNLSRFAQDKKNVAFSFTHNNKNMTPGTIPSNLGKLNLQTTYGNLHLDRMVFLPAISEIVPLILGGIGAGGRIVFSLTFAEPIRNNSSSREQDMIRIRNRALEYIGFPEKVSERAIE